MKAFVLNTYSSRTRYPELAGKNIDTLKNKGIKMQDLVIPDASQAKRYARAILNDVFSRALNFQLYCIHNDISFTENPDLQKLLKQMDDILVEGYKNSL
jgi:hypothetical protein